MTADSDQEAPLDFYLTPPHPCSYLDRSDAQTLFADPRRIITSTAYQQLSRSGFPSQRRPPVPAQMQPLQCLHRSQGTHQRF